VEFAGLLMAASVHVECLPRVGSWEGKLEATQLLTNTMNLQESQ
jgi:hypothetical protein